MNFEKTNANNAWCPGCGNFMILNALKQVLNELQGQGFSEQNTVLVSGIGQAAKMPQYIQANYYNGLHGRALPAATGIKAANKNLNVIVTSGEGDIYGEGGNHFIHAVRRNPNITVIVSDNMVYGLTKGQSSPTSQLGYVTKTQPDGNIDEPLNPLAIAIAQNISFAARAFCQDIEQTKNIIKEAVNHRGFALVDVLQPCVTFNKINTYQWFRENSYYLDENYNPNDRMTAFQTVTENNKFALGIIYKHESVPFEEKEIIKDKSPVFEGFSGKSLDKEGLQNLIADFQ